MPKRYLHSFEVGVFFFVRNEALDGVPEFDVYITFGALKYLMFAGKSAERIVMWVTYVSPRRRVAGGRLKNLDGLSKYFFTLPLKLH